MNISVLYKQSKHFSPLMTNVPLLEGAVTPVDYIGVS